MPLRELDFNRQNLTLALSEVKDMFQMHIGQGCRYVAKRVCDKILAVDFDSYMSAGRYERTGRRRGYRNGYRRRSLLTSVGNLELKVPRGREGGYQPCLWRRYQRVEGSLEETIRAVFLHGVSTRKVGEVLEVLCGERLSASKVSTVLKELDEAVRDYAHRPIRDDFVVVFLDALTVTVRFEVKAKKIKLLVAYGIRSDGSRCLISFQRAHSESYACWKAFVGNLLARGLKGEQLQLLVMDGAAGLWAAVAEIYPLIPCQLCWVHKLRNVSGYCPVRYRRDCVSQAARIMYAPSAGVAAKRFRAWRKRWKETIPKAVACVERDFDRLITVFQFPAELHKMIRTTNVIERCFAEVRRRLRVMGYFHNSKSCDRIIYSLFTYFNNKWQRNTEKIKQVQMLTNQAA